MKRILSSVGGKKRGNHGSLCSKQESDLKENFYNYIKVSESQPLREIKIVSNGKRMVFINGSYYFCQRLMSGER